MRKVIFSICLYLVGFLSILFIGKLFEYYTKIESDFFVLLITYFIGRKWLELLEKGFNKIGFKSE